MQIEMSIRGLMVDPITNMPIVVLRENEGSRVLPIWVGVFEANAIALQIENVETPRPMTHDLFKNFADRFQIVIKQVIIHKLVDGVFYSSIICERDKIEEIIDARTSDAIALALRFDAPIFTYKAILDKAGIFLKFSSKDKDEEGDDSIMVDEILQEGEAVELDPGSAAPYKEMSLEDLRKELEKAMAGEDYEKAAKLRDEISKRKS